MCSLLYIYAFRANASIVHCMMCYCIDLECMWFGKVLFLTYYLHTIMLVSLATHVLLASIQVRARYQARTRKAVLEAGVRCV